MKRRRLCLYPVHGGLRCAGVSGEINCKRYETPWLHTTRQIHGENKNKQKPGNTATTRKSPGQICVSPADSEPTQKKGPEPQPKNHTRITRIASDTIGVSPTCLRNMHKKRISESMARKRGEKLCNCEKQQQNCCCALRQPP